VSFSLGHPALIKQPTSGVNITVLFGSSSLDLVAKFEGQLCSFMKVMHRVVKEFDDIVVIMRGVTLLIVVGCIQN
jgi:hypothetical protein